MAWTSLRPGRVIEDLKNDRKSAVKVEQYRISQNAVYLPGNEYIPLETVEKVQLRNGMMTTKGCCGLSIPVFNVILFYGAIRPKGLMCEKQTSAEQIIKLICEAHPEIIEEEYIPPYAENDAQAEAEAQPEADEESQPEES